MSDDESTTQRRALAELLFDQIPATYGTRSLAFVMVVHPPTGNTPDIFTNAPNASEVIEFLEDTVRYLKQRTVVLRSPFTMQ